MKYRESQVLSFLFVMQYLVAIIILFFVPVNKVWVSLYVPVIQAEFYESFTYQSRKLIPIPAVSI